MTTTGSGSVIRTRPRDEAPAQRVVTLSAALPEPVERTQVVRRAGEPIANRRVLRR